MKEEEVAICVAKERANIDAIKKNLKKIVRIKQCLHAL